MKFLHKQLFTRFYYDARQVPEVFSFEFSIDTLLYYFFKINQQRINVKLKFFISFLHGINLGFFFLIIF